MTKYYLNPKKGTIIGLNDLGEIFEIDAEAGEIIKLDELTPKQANCSAGSVGVTKRKYTRREKASGDDLEEDDEQETKAKKINWRTINKIQELKKAGYTSGQISEELGLTLAAVNKYYAQKTSAHSY